MEKLLMLQKYLMCLLLSREHKANIYNKNIQSLTDTHYIQQVDTSFSAESLLDILPLGKDGP